MPKPKSGRRSKNLMSNSSTGMLMAKTIGEANKLAIQYGLAKEADFTGLDIRVANEMIVQLKKYQDEFPGILQLDFIGSHRALVKRERELVTSLGLKYKNYRLTNDTAAMNLTVNSSDGRIRRSIILNANLFSSKRYELTLEKMRDNEKGFFLPVGCGKLKALIDHEVGHHIDRRFGITSKNKAIQSLFNQHHVDKEWIDIPNGWQWNNHKMTNALSAYANTNIKEFIAEAWSEYRNNPNPRPVAKKVGDEIIKYIKPSKKHMGLFDFLFHRNK